MMLENSAESQQCVKTKAEALEEVVCLQTSTPIYLQAIPT